jgi:short-subunit dehydrogenase
MQHTKKIWFITGISSGLGKALTEELIKLDHFVIGTFRSQHQADEFNKTYSGKAHAIQLDVTDRAGIQKAYTILYEKFKRINVLVNNAGIGFAGAIEESSDEEIRTLFETNFFGALEITKTFLPLLRQQKFGHIFQISSHGGIKATAGFGIYNASKFALEGFSEALAQEIQPLGLTLTLVEPGPFRTEFAGKSFVFAKTIIGDYHPTAGSFRERIKNTDGKQEGDPVRAAQILIQLANSDNVPLRLPLGKIALQTFRSKISDLQSDLESTRELAEKAVF